MKTASVYEIQHNFSRVLSWVVAGETVVIQRRNVPVAKLVGVENESPQLPDFMSRLEAAFGDRVAPDSGGIFEELREDRF